MKNYVIQPSTTVIIFVRNSLTKKASVFLCIESKSQLGQTCDSQSLLLSFNLSILSFSKSNKLPSI